MYVSALWLDMLEATCGFEKPGFHADIHSSSERMSEACADVIL